MRLGGGGPRGAALNESVLTSSRKNTVDYDGTKALYALFLIETKSSLTDARVLIQATLHTLNWGIRSDWQANYRLEGPWVELSSFFVHIQVVYILKSLTLKTASCIAIKLSADECYAKDFCQIKSAYRISSQKFWDQTEFIFFLGLK